MEEQVSITLGQVSIAIASLIGPVANLLAAYANDHKWSAKMKLAVLCLLLFFLVSLEAVVIMFLTGKFTLGQFIISIIFAAGSSQVTYGPMLKGWDLASIERNKGNVSQ